MWRPMCRMCSWEERQLTVFAQGPLYVQKLTRELVRKHREQEIALGKEIWPATPKHSLSSENEDDIAFCNDLDCVSERRELVW